MVDSGRVPGKGRIRASMEKLSRRELEKGRICLSTEKGGNPGEYREKVESLRVSKTVLASIGKGLNLCEYRKMVESGRVSGKGRIRASMEKLSRRVPEKVESVRVSKNCLDEYRKSVEAI